MTDIRFGSMVVEGTGTGAAVVMVHGLGGSSNSFETLMRTMAGYRVLRPDLPGAARSPYRPGRPGLHALVVALRDCLRAHGVERGHLVGHSMGGLICQHLAAGMPGFAVSLTVLGPILALAPAARQSLRDRAKAVRSGGMAAVADAVSALGIAPAGRQANPVLSAFVRESLMRQDPRGYAAHCEALAGAGMADHARIDCPTLLVAGAEDAVAPVEMARRLQTRIHGARLEILAGVGHWMMAEAPQRMAELLLGHMEAAQTGPRQIREQDHGGRDLYRMERKSASPE